MIKVKRTSMKYKDESGNMQDLNVLFSNESGGATEEQVAQIIKNKEDIKSLSEEIVDLTAYVTPQMYEGTDTEKIQQAINANKYVLIPAGSYSITSTITIPSDRKIQIEGNITVNCAVGFLLQGKNIQFCGNGSVNIATNLTECTVIKVLVEDETTFINIDDISLWGSWNYNNSNNHIGVEFVGSATVGYCCYVNIDCNINCMTKAIWTHKATEQHSDSWLTQVDVNSTIQNCYQAVVYDWGGDASRIHGVIQPKCTSNVTANSRDLAVCVLPNHTYLDAMIWDLDSAMNKYAVEVRGNYCTIHSVIASRYLNIADGYKSTIVLRKPTEKIVTTDGCVFDGNVKFSGREVGLVLKKPSGEEEVIQLAENGLVVGGMKFYTNQLPKAKDTNRTSIYNGIGYKANARLSSNGSEVAHDGVYVSGFISATAGDIVRIFDVTVTSVQNTYIIAYDSSNNRTGYIQWNGPGSEFVVRENNPSGRSNLTITLDKSAFGENFNAIRFSSGVIDGNTIVTVNEKIDDSFDMVKSINGKTGNVELPIPKKLSDLDDDIGIISTDETITMVGIDADGNSHTWTVYGKAVSS